MLKMHAKIRNSVKECFKLNRSINLTFFCTKTKNKQAKLKTALFKIFRPENLMILAPMNRKWPEISGVSLA
jgi:hypothetical protein